MAKVNRMTEPPDAITEEEAAEQYKLAMKLVADILDNKIADIKPLLDFTSELGFNYPVVEKALKNKGEEVLSILEYLTERDILKREFFERLLRCPQCQSMNLRPSMHCPKCGSANIARGRVLEHFVCKYVGIEEEFITRGRYICPKCQVELRTIGTDYQSLGMMRKCHDCDEIFTTPVLKWRCLKCSSITAEDKISDVTIYSYSLNEKKRTWLEFELRPKAQLLTFLRQQGYDVQEHATMTGRSGAEHIIDILATRDDGVIAYNIAIGVEVAGETIGLEKIFDFDDKAYDIGIHDKMLVVIPTLGGEAQKFANLQKIKVLEVRDLDTILGGATPKPSREIEGRPFRFRSKSHLTRFLQKHGYEVKEEATMKGRSGAEHIIDILATRDEGIITHHIAIGIEESDQPIELDRVFDFDDKAYDIGIQDKVLIVVPSLSEEAKHYAERQQIKVFTAKELEPSS